MDDDQSNPVCLRPGWMRAILDLIMLSLLSTLNSRGQRLQLILRTNELPSIAQRMQETWEFNNGSPKGRSNYR